MATNPDEERKKAAAPRPGTSVPGNPARAQAMQAQYNQPVYKGYGPAGAPERPPAPVASKPEPQAPQQRLGMTLTPEQVEASTKKAQLEQSRKRQAEFKAGVGNTLDRLGNSAMNVANMPGRTIIEGAKQIGAFVGNTRFDNSLPDYSNKGLEQRKAANWAKNNPAQADAARVGMRAVADRATSAAIGQVKAAPPAIAPIMGAANTPVSLNAPTTSATDATTPSAAPPATSDAGPQAQPGPGFQRTSVDGVVGRVGANGVPEFSNAPNDVSSASDSQMTSGRMGNGVGGLSVGEAGDSQLALERFQRANDIRAQTIADRRRGQIGENGGLFIAGNGSDAMERAQERREMSIAAQGGAPLRAMAQNEDARIRREEGRQRDAADQQRIGMDRQRLAMEGAESAATLGMRERELANAEQTGQLERQRIGMELETGQLGLEQQRQIQQLRKQLADPNLDPATREQIQRTYNTLTTPAKDRYMLQDVVMGHDSMGAPIFGKQALDVATGQMAGQGQQGGQAQAQAPQFQSGKIYKDASGNRARYMGTDAQGNPQWEQL